jgi:catechol 2,3-dioxygenase-like lactoylglutathione lyase family enzyme
MPTAFLQVRLRAAAPQLPELIEFYGNGLGLGVAQPESEVAFEVGESTLEFTPGSGSPFYHVALLGPGNRFDAMLEWARSRVELLPDSETGDTVFDFTSWDAKACYFHDPAGNILELIAHHGLAESGATGVFTATELRGISEVGLVGDPPTLAAALGRELGLELWDGTTTGERRLAFVGEKARTLILCRAGRPWLPTGRPAESHAVDVVLSGRPESEVHLDAGGFVRRTTRSP